MVIYFFPPFQLNIPALGFMPMPNTPVLLHDHDEFLNADVYLNGINIYEKIIENVGNAMEPTVILKL